uniref:Venom peptide Tnr9.3ii n=1 Tax=Turris normandavidsoni TaxID=439607 RepID=A0A976LX65_9CAEN|nr:venom peptide precursor Tnr9.3ii [Turris normandavidsoni]
MRFLTLTLLLTAVMSIATTPINPVEQERSAMSSFLKTFLLLQRRHGCSCEGVEVGSTCSGNDCAAVCRSDGGCWIST